MSAVPVNSKLPSLVKRQVTVKDGTGAITNGCMPFCLQEEQPWVWIRVFWTSCEVQQQKWRGTVAHFFVLDCYIICNNSYGNFQTCLSLRTRVKIEWCRAFRDSSPLSSSLCFSAEWSRALQHPRVPVVRLAAWESCHWSGRFWYGGWVRRWYYTRSAGFRFHTSA